MKKSSFAKGAIVMGLAVAGLCCMMGCSGTSGLTGGTAATVNGVEIKEDTITTAIEDMRSAQSLTDADTWATYLNQYGYTPESFREMVIDGYVSQELLKQKAADLGVTADAETVDSYVATMKANYDSDEAWQQALEKVGITEEKYRESLELSILREGVRDALVTSDEPSEESLLSYAKMYGTSYDGAKRSSHILFDASAAETAQSVLDQINAGTLDFAEAAKQYSKDSSGASGGDVGWDKLTTFVSEYQTALDGLEVNQVSGLVTSEYGIHIIKCTEVFDAPEEITSADQLPEAFRDSVKSMAMSSDASDAYNTWLEEQREASEIVINEMPADVPYNVDMSKFETDDASDASATDSGADANAEDGGDAGDDANAGDDADAASDEGSSSADEAASEQPAEATEESKE